MRSLLLATLFVAASLLPAQDRPNILWITAEDHGPDLGCYGVDYADTPNLDALAARGVIYRNCWSNAPVCAPARTTIATGMYPPSIGAEHMRSLVPLPEGVKLFPQLLREAGYFCTNRRKTDYNVEAGGEVWDRNGGQAHWRQRPVAEDGSAPPFYAVFNFTQSHESQIRKRPHEAVHDPATVPLPAHHPDTPEVRQDWAQYHDRITVVDEKAGEVLRQLEEDGLADDTIVFFFADHGAGMPGHKRTAKQTGLHVPLIVHVPEKWRERAFVAHEPGSATDQLVGFVDLAPTMLSLCGVERPEWMHGKAFLGPDFDAGAPVLFGFRARMDERIDLVRSVRDERYVYVRNLLPRLPHGQFNDYMFQTPTTRVWKALHDAGELDPVQDAYWRSPRAPEELYDLESDPGETVNLAGDPAHAATLERLRAAYLQHERTFGDLSLLPESLMLAECGDASPASLLERDGADARFAELLRFSEYATGHERLGVDILLARSGSADPAIRWWCLQGLAHRDDLPFAKVRPALITRLADPAPCVRILAAELLASHGDAEDVGRAVDVLADLGDPKQSDWWVAIEAWNAIDHLDAEAAPHRAKIEAISIELEDPPGRGDFYLQRLRDRTLATIGG